MPLTTLEIKNAKPGMHADGSGLYLHVRPAGTASWIFRYQLNKRRREMGLGALKALPPVVARAEAARLKALVARGVDPLEEKRAEREAVESDERAQTVEREQMGATFRKAAEQHIARQEAGWRNTKHRLQWESTLRTYAHPIIGDMPVREITSQHVLKVLQPIWATKPETASRVRMRIEAVLNSAKLMGWRSGENPAIWRGGLEGVLPRKSKVKKVRHHAALPWRQVPKFVGQLRTRDGIAARALEFLILTAARSGEVRHARWDEVDTGTCLWTVPEDRMKAGREHRVPLSAAALEIYKQMPRLENCPYVFPGARSGPMSDMSLTAVLRRMGLGEYTVHGFRSSFRDWAAEHTDHDRDAVELALAHTISSKTEAAYRRGDLLLKRQALMSDWAAWCNT